MADFLPAAVAHNQLWHLIPLIIAISLVYGATRHELLAPILANAVRFGIWMIGFIAVVFAILFWVARGL